MPRGKDLMMEVLQREGLKYKISLDLRRGFLTKFLLSFLSLGMIGCLNLSLNMEGILVHQPKSQLVESVARITKVIDLRGRTIVLVVVKLGTMLGIARM